MIDALKPGLVMVLPIVMIKLMAVIFPAMIMMVVTVVAVVPMEEEILGRSPLNQNKEKNY